MIRGPVFRLRHDGGILPCGQVRDALGTDGVRRRRHDFLCVLGWLGCVYVGRQSGDYFIGQVAAGPPARTGVYFLAYLFPKEEGMPGYLTRG